MPPRKAAKKKTAVKKKPPKPKPRTRKPAAKKKTVAPPPRKKKAAAPPRQKAKPKPKPKPPTRKKAEKKKKAAARLPTRKKPGGQKRVQVVPQEEQYVATPDAWNRFRQLEWLEGPVSVHVLSQGDRVFIMINDETHDRECLSGYCSGEKQNRVNVAQFVQTLTEAMQEKPNLQKQTCVDVFLEAEFMRKADEPFGSYCPNEPGNGNINVMNAELLKLGLKHPNLRVHTTDTRYIEIGGHGAMYQMLSQSDDALGALAKSVKEKGDASEEAQQKYEEFKSAMRKIQEPFLERLEAELISSQLKIHKQGQHARGLLAQDLDDLRSNISRTTQSLPVLLESMGINFYQAHTRKFGRDTPVHLLDPLTLEALVDAVMLQWPTDQNTKGIWLDAMYGYWVEFTVYVGSMYLDVYGFARMMKQFDTSIVGRKCRDSPEVHLGIVYAGDYHVFRYQNWLQVMGYQLQVESNSTLDGTKRCISLAPVSAWLSSYCSGSTRCVG